MLYTLSSHLRTSDLLLSLLPGRGPLDNFVKHGSSGTTGGGFDGVSVSIRVLLARLL